MDKLKILANNPKELWEARKTIARREAIKNGHDMTEWTSEKPRRYIVTIYYSCHCTECPFELHAEERHYSGREYKYLLNEDILKEKCPAI